MRHLLLAILLAAQELAISTNGSYGYPGPVNTAWFVSDTLARFGTMGYEFCESTDVDTWCLAKPGYFSCSMDCWQYGPLK